MIFDEKWNLRFLDLARHISTWSKDPSTKVGAVIVDPNRRVVSVGYNGFARGVADHDHLLHNREEKYKRVIHAERNALLFAHAPVKRCTLYIWPLSVCSQCAAMFIQVEIAAVVHPNHNDFAFSGPAWQATLGRWEPDTTLAKQMLHEAAVASIPVSVPAAWLSTLDT